MHTPLRIGHRGAPVQAPENTLASFAKAIEFGVDMIELDVHVCKTGEVVVMHDDTVDRTTNGKGRIADMTLDELKALDAGKGERIPTLEEVFNLVDKRVQIIIELKENAAIEPTMALIGRCISKEGWTNEHFMLSSFDHYMLRQCKELMPDVRLGAILAGVPIGYAEFGEQLGAYSVNMAYPFLNKEFIDDAHRRGLRVFAWPVDEPTDIEHMKALGVDGIISNVPDRI